MYSIFMITFREGIEAFLIVAICAAFLKQTGNQHLSNAVRYGVIVATALCAILGVFLVEYGGFTPMWEGYLAMIAAFLVISCTVHMLRHGKKMKQEITEKLKDASAKTVKNASIAVFLFVLLMISREGVEAAMMVASLASQNSGFDLLSGAILGILCAAGMGAAWIRYGNRVNLTRFFQVTAIFMVLFSIQLIIYAFHEFSEAAALPFVNNEFWHIATEPYGPQGQYGQWLSYGLVLIPTLFLFVIWLKDKTLSHSLINVR